MAKVALGLSKTKQQAEETDGAGVLGKEHNGSADAVPSTDPFCVPEPYRLMELIGEFVTNLVYISQSLTLTVWIEVAFVSSKTVAGLAWRRD